MQEPRTGTDCDGPVSLVKNTKHFTVPLTHQVSKSPSHPLAHSQGRPIAKSQLAHSPSHPLAPSHLEPRTSHLRPVTTSPGRQVAPSLPRTSHPEPRTFAQSPRLPVSKSLQNSNNFTIFIETADIIIPFLFSD